MEQPTVTSPTPAVSAATPASQEPVTTTGTAPSAAETSATPTPSQAGSTSSTKAPEAGEDNFTDPNSVPPELKGKYDSMLGDYKKKTAELAALRREAESAVEAQKILNMIASDPDMVSAWNRKYGNQNVSQPQPDYVSDPMAVKREVDGLKASLLVKDFKASHADFEELDSDGLITGYVQVNPPKSEREWNQTLTKAYEYAKSVTSKWTEKGRKDGLTRVAEKASQATLPPTAAPEQNFTGDPKKLSVAEAVALARKGIRVS